VAISINPATKVISILQADLTFVSGDLYELDTDQFRKDVMDLLSSEPFAWMPDAYDHNSEYTVVGVTYARKVEMINGYSITFENNVYTVRLAGSNNNIFDVEGGILNPSGNVTVVGQNSAGLIVVTSGSGLSAAQATQLIEIYTRLGLNLADPITDTTGGIDSDSGDIEITRSGDGETSSRLVREP